MCQHMPFRPAARKYQHMQSPMQHTVSWHHIAAAAYSGSRLQRCSHCCMKHACHRMPGRRGLHLQLVGVPALGGWQLGLFRLLDGLLQSQHAALLGQLQHMLEALGRDKVYRRLDARRQVAHLQPGYPQSRHRSSSKTQNAAGYAAKGFRQDCCPLHCNLACLAMLPSHMGLLSDKLRSCSMCLLGLVSTRNCIRLATPCHVSLLTASGDSRRTMSVIPTHQPQPEHLLQVIVRDKSQGGSTWWGHPAGMKTAS